MFGKGYLRVGELNPMYDKTLTDTHKKRMSESLTGLKKQIITEKLSKPIIQFDKNYNYINEFSSITEVLKSIKILHISEVCNGLRKSAGGFLWKFK